MATSGKLSKEDDGDRLVSLTQQMLSIDHEEDGHKLAPLLDCFSLAEDKCSLQPDFTWKIDGIEDKMKYGTCEVESQAFEWAAYPGVVSRVKLEVNTDWKAYVSLRLQDDIQGEAIDTKLIPAIYYVLRDQSGNGKHRSRVANCSFTSKFNSSLTFDLRLVHKCALNDPSYKVDDSVAIDVYVEPPSAAQKTHSHDGTINWGIDHFRKRKLMGQEGEVWYAESPYFYSGSKGFRLKVNMWLYGYKENRGKMLLAQIKFLSGEFDDELPVTFPHRTTVTLFNPKDSMKRISRSKKQEIPEKKTYFITMGTDEEVEEVIDNDRVNYTVTVTPLGHK